MRTDNAKKYYGRIYASTTITISNGKLMEYDPIKRKLGEFINKSTLLRRLFYFALHLIFIREWYIKRLLNRIINKKGNKEDFDILDAGFGFGQYSYYCANKFPNVQVVGMEIKAEQVKDTNEFAQKVNRKNMRFETGDLTQLDYINKFDLITAIAIMEHIEEDVKVFHNFAKALKPAGYFIMNTPWCDETGERAHLASEVGEHVREGYSYDNLKPKLDEAGFKIISFEYINAPSGAFARILNTVIPMHLWKFGIIGKIIIPFYLISFFPLFIILMLIDYLINNKAGNGIVVLAQKIAGSRDSSQ